MSAVLTLSAVAVAADGKTVTATIAGGTGTGYTCTSINGLYVFPNTGNKWALPITSVSVTGSTLTVNLNLPVGSGEAVLMSTAATSNLADSGANTISPQTNLAITNSSAVAVTILAASNTGIEYVDANDIEFVADATDVGVYVFVSSSTVFYVDDGNTTTTITSATQGNDAAVWSCRALGVGLAAAKHLFRSSTNSFGGVRLSGSTHSVVSIAKTKTPMNNFNGFTWLPATSVVTRWNGSTPTLPTDPIHGNPAFTGHGVEYTFAFNGTGVEVNGVTDALGAMAVTLDAQPFTNPVVMTDAAGTNNTQDFYQIVSGRTNVAHQVAVFMADTSVTAWVNYLRVLTGSALTSAASVGASAVLVASVTNIAVGAWVYIGQAARREYRQVSSITGTGPYTVNLSGATLRFAHAIGEQVEAYNSPAGTISTWVRKDLSARRIIGIGDSTTAAWNEYGNAGTADANGIFYHQYDGRKAPLHLTAESLGWEFVNQGTPGADSFAKASGAAGIFNVGTTYDAVIIWVGTNDINSTGTTPTAWKANVKTIIDAAVPYLKTSGRIIVMPTPTPNGVTSSGGLNVATEQAKIAELVAAYPGVVYDGSPAVARIVVGDEVSLHYNDSGKLKVSQDIVPLIAGTNIFVNNGTYAFPAGSLIHQP